MYAIPVPVSPIIPLPVVVDVRPKLGYWSVRGLAHPIRLLLNYLAIDYVDERYEFGPAPEFDRSSWLSVKSNLGLDFPNLPYYIDDAVGVRLTQSGAILRHIAESRGLAGVTVDERAAVSMLEGTILDYRSAYGKLSYDPEFETKKDAFFESSAKDFLVSIEKYIVKTGGPFLLGLNPTLPDFLLFEAVEALERLRPEFLLSYPVIVNFLTAFRGLPTLFNYLNSPSHTALSFGGPRSFAKI